MVCLHNMNLIAVASTELKIGEFPRLHGPSFGHSHTFAFGRGLLAEQP
jgi:hypothetical protein